MASIVSRLNESLENNSCKSAVVSIRRLEEIETALADLKLAGAIDAGLYPEITKYFNFDYTAALPEARSIIVVASPQLPTCVLFDSHPVTIPPTYIYRNIWKRQLQLVTDFLEPFHFQVARARLPFKTLAVRSGLGRYGRNNLCYIPGLGSFFRLAAFYSDIPCEQDTWAPPESMKLCQTCTSCSDNCPTGCISTNRFLVKAEMCLTHFNESQNPLPGWIDPGWHNALLGCMLCQKCCPLNKEFLKKPQDLAQTFNAVETSAILSGIPQQKLLPETIAKLESLCLADSDIYPLLKRNLSLLLDQ
jgi:epoxyqueuosine reductase